MKGLPNPSDCLDDRALGAALQRAVNRTGADLPRAGWTLAGYVPSRANLCASPIHFVACLHRVGPPIQDGPLQCGATHEIRSTCAHACFAVDGGAPK